MRGMGLGDGHSSLFVSETGSWFSFGGERKDVSRRFQGLEELVEQVRLYNLLSGKMYWLRD